MKPFTFSTLAIAIVALFTSALLANVSIAGGHEKKPDQAKPKNPFSVTKITESISLLQGVGGNIVVHSGKDGILMIDNDLGQVGEPLIETLETFGGAKKVKYLINTHWHGDHTGNNEKLGEFTDFIAHNNVRVRMASKQTNNFFKSTTPPSPEVALPTFTYNDELTIHFNGDEVLVKHYAGGHTDGDSVIYFKEANVLHTGDQLFNGFFPFVDLSSKGNALNFRDNVGKMIESINDKTVVVPGHGALLTKAEMIQYHNMLIDTINIVQTMKDDGLSLKEAQAKGLGEKYKAMGTGFIKEPAWISFIYASLW